MLLLYRCCCYILYLANRFWFELPPHLIRHSFNNAYILPTT